MASFRVPVLISRVVYGWLFDRNWQLVRKSRARCHPDGGMQISVPLLQGNIRVFCRVRPMLMSEADQPEIFTYPDLDEKKVS